MVDGTREAEIKDAIMEYVNNEKRQEAMIEVHFRHITFGSLVEV